MSRSRLISFALNKISGSWDVAAALKEQVQSIEMIAAMAVRLAELDGVPPALASVPGNHTTEQEVARLNGAAAGPTAVRTRVGASLSGAPWCLGISALTPLPYATGLRAERRKRIDGGLADVQVSVPGGGAEGIGGAGVRNVAESLGDSRAHAPARILKSSREGLQGTGIANPTESLRSGPAHARALVVEEGRERSYGAGVADLA